MQLDKHVLMINREVKIRTIGSKSYKKCLKSFSPQMKVFIEVTYLYIAYECFLCADNKRPNLPCPTNFQDLGPCKTTLVQYSYYSNLTPIMDL